MLYFRTRQDARNFAGKSGRKVKDNGKGAVNRWAVKVVQGVVE